VSVVAPTADGELLRAGAFSGCHRHAKAPTPWRLGDGCGQLNVLGVVHPEKAPAGLAPIPPDLPGAVDQEAIMGLLSLRLPR
jgi:hypothetical protein